MMACCMGLYLGALNTSLYSSLTYGSRTARDVSIRASHSHPLPHPLPHTQAHKAGRKAGPSARDKHRQKKDGGGPASTSRASIKAGTHSGKLQRAQAAKQQR